MRTDIASSISRLDYQPYPYSLVSVDLAFDLQTEQTRVVNRLVFERIGTDIHPLVLDGQALQLECLTIDGVRVPEANFKIENDTLAISTVPASFTLEITSLCRPADNSSLMGLYVSGDKLFTQCEAEGFRPITWFRERPSVMSRSRRCSRVVHCRHAGWSCV